MTTHSIHAPITIKRSACSTHVEAAGKAALAILDEIANGAPTLEAAAFAAWLKGFPQTDAVEEQAA